jgi:type IV pilus assembly protein PilA
MYSSQCPNCGLIGWATDVCKRCGQPFAPANQTGYAGQHSTYAPHAYGTAAPFKQRTGLAIASMVLAIISFFTFLFLIGIPGSIVALVLGIVALCQIKRDPAQYGGRGFAIAGVAISSVALFFLVPIVAAIAIPNLLASRRAANEASAIRSLRVIGGAEQTYQSTVGAGRDFGNLTQLQTAELLEGSLVAGERSGYRFQVTCAGLHFAATATPVNTATGTRSFFISEDGVIHAANKHGLAADEEDPILGN